MGNDNVKIARRNPAILRRSAMALTSPAVKSESIASISPGETITLQTQLQFGIELMNYNVSASWGNCTVYYDRNYLLIGILIIPL